MTQDKITKFLKITAFVAVLLILVFVGIKYVVPLVMPFIIGFVLALIMNRPIKFIAAKTKVSKKIVSPIITLLFVGVIMSAIVVIIYRAGGELASFISNIPTWYNDFAPVVVDQINDLFGRLLDSFSVELAEDIKNIASDFLTYVQTALMDLSKNLLSWLGSMATRLPSLILAFFISIIASFFLAGKTDAIKAGIKRQIPEKYQNTARELYRKGGQTLLKMVRAYIYILLITFAELSVGLAILRVDYFIVIAALTALLDILPVLGTGTVLIPWGIVELIVGDTAMGIKILALWAIITVIRNIIEPRLVGRQIGLSPVITLMGMYLGLQLFGMLGLFLVPMMIIVLKSANDIGVIKLWKYEDEDDGGSSGDGGNGGSSGGGRKSVTNYEP